MSTAPTDSPIRTSAAARRDGLLRTGVIGATVAVLLNIALLAGGRAADVSFSVTPVGSDTSSEVGIGLVVAGTLVGFGIGWALLAWATRRSTAWVQGLLVTAALVALASALAPLGAADDTDTGVLLACMHVVTGAVFVVAAWLPGRR